MNPDYVHTPDNPWWLQLAGRRDPAVAAAPSAAPSAATGPQPSTHPGAAPATPAAGPLPFPDAYQVPVGAHDRQVEHIPVTDSPADGAGDVVAVVAADPAVNPAAATVTAAASPGAGYPQLQAMIQAAVSAALSQPPGGATIPPPPGTADPAEGTHLATPPPDPALAALFSRLPARPRRRVVYEWGEQGGTTSTFYHAIVHGAECLVLVYDTRYEGEQTVPPARQDPLKLHVTGEQGKRETYFVDSVGIQFTLGWMDCVVLLVREQELRVPAIDGVEF